MNTEEVLKLIKEIEDTKKKIQLLELEIYELKKERYNLQNNSSDKKKSS